MKLQLYRHFFLRQILTLFTYYPKIFAKFPEIVITSYFLYMKSIPLLAGVSVGVQRIIKMENK